MKKNEHLDKKGHFDVLLHKFMQKYGHLDRKEHFDRKGHLDTMYIGIGHFRRKEHLDMIGIILAWNMATGTEKGS